MLMFVLKTNEIDKILHSSVGVLGLRPSSKGQPETRKCNILRGRLQKFQ